ncbi:MAG TPA: hypothetical protein EYO33_13550 [Phycisphaerales bacterium]|nr:hypothetical protein [Phycisphaerales bacterium]
MQRLFLLTLIFLTTASCVAKEVLLVKTRNDFNERDDRLYLELDENGTPYELVHRAYDLVMGVYRLEDLNKGVNLREYKGKAVLKMDILNFDPETGGEASLSYLEGVVPTARYGSMKFNLQKHQGRWRLFQTGDDRPVQLLFFRTNFSTVLGVQQPTGIKEIRVLKDRK